ncbi:MAG: twin-arginine translocation signal domain-containing protein [Nitrospirota bacterium]|nr:twin-arginine translocation signal domain-containing protein [Nitrospirota bacterium]MDE3035400.1 twin-arginine translocation signal domain-containing protein [Nitrospirota bacterium]MDE3119111.1 twin-arginine translocation signal domain-containing protein [Nitrospirota bacterium]MDE3226496.1 twin-arginine translocation signal domain-containing protein [Nitrospirota bacterium]MDE3244126.1 twin-arginine translocation signal domain-containing protein [Nitrospirota bacterium]
MSSTDTSKDGKPGSDQSNEALLEEIPPDRREFVKRLLVGTAAGVAIVTSLFIPEVMAGKGRGSPNGYD